MLPSLYDIMTVKQKHELVLLCICRGWHTILESSPSPACRGSPPSCMLIIIRTSSNGRNEVNIPSIYSVVYSCISVTFGEGPTSIDPLILPPSQPIWSHSHILLSKNFDPEGLIWNFPTCWVINGLTLVFSCLLPQYHCRDRNGTSHAHPEYFPV